MNPRREERLTMMLSSSEQQDKSLMPARVMQSGFQFVFLRLYLCVSNFHPELVLQVANA